MRLIAKKHITMKARPLLLYKSRRIHIKVKLLPNTLIGLMLYGNIKTIESNTILTLHCD